MKIKFMKNQSSTFTTILLALAFFGLLPGAQAVVPGPDGGYPGGNTAEVQNALLSLTTGTYNCGLGFRQFFRKNLIQMITLTASFPLWQ